MTKTQIEYYEKLVAEFDEKVRRGAIGYAYAYGFMKTTCSNILAAARLAAEKKV